MIVRRISLALFVTTACGGTEALEESSDEATTAEARALGTGASVWRNTVSLARCGRYGLNENFSSGRYNAHRFRAPVGPDAPVEVRFERTGGTFDPAIVVATPDGARLFDGRSSTAIAGIEVTMLDSGRETPYATIAIESPNAATVDVYLTSWETLDARFGRAIPTSAKYALSIEQTCNSTEGWSGVYAGLEQSGSMIPRRGLECTTLRQTLGHATEPYGELTDWQNARFVSGRISHFGGPSDSGVGPTERGAITGELVRSLNSPEDPSESQLAARPGDFYYAAMRFDYSPNGREFWSQARLLVVNPGTGAAIVVRPVDWGPHTSTARVIDLSPQSLKDLGLETDETVLVAFAAAGAPLGRLLVAPPIVTRPAPPTQPAPPSCANGLVCVDRFPWAESGDTRQGARRLAGYSCAPGANESGPENLYKVTLPADGFLSAEVSGMASGVDVDLHLLAANGASACLDRGDVRAGAYVRAGEYFIAADTWVSGSGVELSGAYTVTFGFVAARDLANHGLRSTVADRALQAFGKAFANDETDRLLYTIADFDVPSDQKRLFTFNLLTGDLVYHLHVAHGSGSGDPNDIRRARAMSNRSGSNMSSVGLMKTAETYIGSHGESLRLDGLESGFNDNVRSRAIVFHAADYAAPAFVSRNGYTGRSWGCPAIDPAVISSFLRDTKGGTLYFSHFSDSSWISSSRYLH
ncbi:MAG: murein L,D-transpeptidase catalytic domain family protein [Deltaproteobacteria bacterium]|nr:murein L,D-transpeptidase catalytic domain family protein [Deltaproteobacteria bacterium]